jgi:hypothetical protein
MIALLNLRRLAVSYAVSEIKIETDYQEIEWNLLNLDQFKPLIASFDVEVLYDCVSEILSEADDQIADEKLRNAQRYDEYLAEYPELDDVMSRER